MKKTSVIKRILILLTALVLILSLGGCYIADGYKADKGDITDNEKNEGNGDKLESNKDDILSEAMRREIEQAHAKMRAEEYAGYNAESKIMHYYGEYKGAYVVYMIDGMLYTCAITGETIGGVKFIYPSSNTLWVYVAGKGFFKLQQAYNKGYLSKSNLSELAQKHREFFAYLYE